MRYRAIVKLSNHLVECADYESDKPIKSVYNLKAALYAAENKYGDLFQTLIGRIPASEQGGNKESQ